MSYEHKNIPSYPIVWLRVKSCGAYWNDNKGRICKNLPVGTITWNEKTQWENCVKRGNTVIFIEDNRYGINFHPECFEEITMTVEGKIKSLSSEIIGHHVSNGRTHSWRYKTEAEFKADGEWDYDCDFPNGWAEDMKIYMGKPVEERYWESCDKGEKTYHNGRWRFQLKNHVKVQFKRDGSQPVSRVSRLVLPQKALK